MEADKLNKLGHDYFLADVTLNSLRPRQESTPGCLLGRKWSLHDPRVVLGCPKPSWAAWAGLRGSRPAPTPRRVWVPSLMKTSSEVRRPLCLWEPGTPRPGSIWHVLVVGCWLKTPCPHPPCILAAGAFPAVMTVCCLEIPRAGICPFIQEIVPGNFWKPVTVVSAGIRRGR